MDTAMNETETEKLKAERATRLLYVLMAIFIFTPLLLFWFTR